MTVTNKEYWDEVRSLAEHFSDDDPASNGWASEYGEDFDKYDAMHETIDGHQFIIYYSKAADVLRHSDNPTAYEDEIGELPKGMTYEQMACPLAYMAMMRDIQDWMHRYEEE